MDEAKETKTFFIKHQELLFAFVEGATQDILDPVLQALGIKECDPFDLTLKLLAPGGERAYDLLVEGYARFGESEFAEGAPSTNSVLLNLRRMTKKRVLRNFRKMLKSVDEDVEKRDLPIRFLGSIWATRRGDRQEILLDCKHDIQQLLALTYPDYTERLPVQEFSPPFGDSTQSAGEVTRVAKLEMQRAVEAESELLCAYRQQAELRGIIADLEKKNLQLQKESRVGDGQRAATTEHHSEKPLAKRRTLVVKPQQLPTRRDLEEQISALEIECDELERALYPEDLDEYTDEPLQLDGLQVLLVGMYDASRVRSAVERVGGQLLHAHGHDSDHAVNLAGQADIIVFAVGQPSYACFCACKKIAQKRDIKYLHWSKKKSVSAFLSLISNALNLT